MIQIYRKLGDEKTARAKEQELITLAPESNGQKLTLLNKDLS